MSHVVAASAVVTADEVLRPGWVEVGEGRVIATGAGAPPRPADCDLGDGLLVPGFVDTHCHGGGGAAFTDISSDEKAATCVATAVRTHRQHGTTRLIASLVSASPDQLRRQVEGLRPHVEAGRLVGIHLEGPWLSPQYRGAHDPAALRVPDTAEIEDLLALGSGTVTMVTLAPELPGGLEAVRRFVKAGVVVALGHTDATDEVTRRALDAGATVATHLFNAMRGLHHREPGPLVALTGDPRVTVEMIADGVHLHPAVYASALAAVGPERVALVTDAMAAAGMPDGRYMLGSVGVDVVGGTATVAGTGTIAGSTGTMDALFRFAVRHGGLTGDAALLAAVRQTAVTPTRAHHLPVAALRPGEPADGVALDSNLQVTGVLSHGVWI